MQTKFDWLVNGQPLSDPGAQPLQVQPGDVIEWIVDSAPNNFHGVMFPNLSQSEVEQLLEFDTSVGLPLVNDPRGHPGWGTDGLNSNTVLKEPDPKLSGFVLARATVKQAFVQSAGLVFICSVHGPTMNGTLAPKSGGGKTVQVVGVTVQSGGSISFEWQVDGQSVSGPNAAPIQVDEGDTIEWHVDPASGNLHGVMFENMTQAEVEALLDFDEGVGQPLVNNPRGRTGWGTEGFGSGTLLARATVKAELAQQPNGLEFICSVHGPQMDGTLSSGAPKTITVVGVTVSTGGAPRFEWQVNGQSISGPNAEPVDVKAGDVIEWQVDPASGNLHGVMFENMTQAEVEQFLTFDTSVGEPLVDNPRGRTGWGTEGFGSGTVLARATVKPELAQAQDATCRSSARCTGREWTAR